MFNKEIPFYSTLLSPNAPSPFKEKQIISTVNKCGFFFCQQGEIEISLENNPYLIKQGDIYIYIPSTLIYIQHKNENTQGIIFEVDLDYILPIINKVINVENILFIREHPCISLSPKQYIHIEQIIKNLHDRIQNNDISSKNKQQQHLFFELIKSMGQSLCLEILNIYFSNQPLQPLHQDKKDIIFQDFMLTLYHFYKKEREVSFYAKKQHITPRYFSCIIKEKSGKSVSQWITQMVIIEAKQLLESSELSIKEIAAYFNFSNQSFFGKYFKQYVGMSPKEYRTSRLNT